MRLRDCNGETENKELAPESPDLTHHMRPPVSVNLSLGNIYPTLLEDTPSSQRSYQSPAPRNSVGPSYYKTGVFSLRKEVAPPKVK